MKCICHCKCTYITITGMVLLGSSSANKIYCSYIFHTYITVDLYNRFMLSRLIRDQNASDALKQ